MNIDRPEYGSGDSQIIKGLKVFENGKEVYKNDSFKLTIPEEKLSETEEREYLDSAVREIEETFCGENTGMYDISSDVIMNNIYVNGKVRAEWSLSDYTYIAANGEYDRDAAKDIEDQSETEAVVVLKCGDTERVHEFSFVVVKPDFSLEEELEAELEDVMSEAVKTGAGNEISLPGTLSIGDKELELTWYEGKRTDMTFIIVAIVALIVLIRYELKERKRRTEAKRKLSLKLSYPEIVNEFSLLMGAGMSLRKSVDMIANGRNKNDFAGAELKRVESEMTNGMSEYEAFVRLGERCNVREYRRFSSLITQNLRHGGKHLGKLLYEESEHAYDERRNIAKKLGEEAGTKLMIPMFMMLAIILVVTVYPAFSSMNI
ncbi:MAG: type II secretion system F family protein [Lachnospiraceae bacterium]|nr:type II secretion system F family protein [Lachnospiraceae bacterium]